MSNHFHDILHHWFAHRDKYDWVLATVVQTKGSSYRQVGAKMMINNFGQSLGMLSGGCLEADLKRQAKKCWATGSNNIVCYDMSDESDITWQLGIGCGGMVKVMLQPVSASNNYLQLGEILERLTQNNAAYYRQIVVNGSPQNTQVLYPLPTQCFDQETQCFDQENKCFNGVILPKPNITIFGGGIDTLPLIALAHTMAWHITLIDSRTNQAQPSVFKLADTIISSPYESLTQHANISRADAIVIMHHNIELDAKAIELAQQSHSNYIGLLGPKHRTKRVLTHDILKNTTLTKPLISPIGLDLGGDLPESIALSIVSQIQAYLENASATPKNEMQTHNLTMINNLERSRHAT